MINKKAFLTIEVLISIIILFSAIVTISASIKAVALLDKKTTTYQTTYITLNSVINLLKKKKIKYENLSFSYTNLHLIDKFNGYKIDTKIKKVNEQYIYEEKEFGELLKTKKDVILMEVQIILKRGNIKKTYKTYLTRVFKR